LPLQRVKGEKVLQPISGEWFPRECKKARGLTRGSPLLLFKARKKGGCLPGLQRLLGDFCLSNNPGGTGGLQRGVAQGWPRYVKRTPSEGEGAKEGCESIPCKERMVRANFSWIREVGVEGEGDNPLRRGRAWKRGFSVS